MLSLPTLAHDALAPPTVDPRATPCLHPVHIPSAPRWPCVGIAEPDVLLEDIVAAIWPSADATHAGVWIKPWTTDSKTKAACTDVNALPTLQANECG